MSLVNCTKKVSLVSRVQTAVCELMIVSNAPEFNLHKAASNFMKVDVEQRQIYKIFFNVALK